MFATFSDWTGISDQPWYVLLIVYPTLTCRLHLDHDRLFRIDSEGTRRSRDHRRRVLVPDVDAHFHSVALPGIIAHIFAFTSHGRSFSIAGIHDIDDHGAASHHHQPDQGDVFNWGQIMTAPCSRRPRIIYAS